MTVHPWLRKSAKGAGFIALLVIAAIVTQTTPSYQTWQSPIPVRGEMAERVTGRNIDATVSRVRVGRSVTSDGGWTGDSTGIWVVVDASVAAVASDDRASLGTAQLQIGSVVYNASMREESATIARKQLSTGIPLNGSLLFEIPEEMLTAEGAARSEIQLAANSDPRSDSMVVVPVDLTGFNIESDIPLTYPTWGAQ